MTTQDLTTRQLDEVVQHVLAICSILELQLPVAQAPAVSGHLQPKPNWLRLPVQPLEHSTDGCNLTKPNYPKWASHPRLNSCLRMQSNLSAKSW